MSGGPLDLRRRPTSDDDYAAARAYMDLHRPVWEAQLLDGERELASHLRASGHRVLSPGDRPGVIAGIDGLVEGEVMLVGRLKEPEAVVAKMRRFREPLCSMLDIWGYRLIVGTGGSIDGAAEAVGRLWSTPSDAELLLRNGELQFSWWRDYRLRSHAGLSPIASFRYDDAIHVNRRASYGIAEFQVMTYDLYRRAYCDPSRDESHERYVTERSRLFGQQ
jgi:hypothetical protein